MMVVDDEPQMLEMLATYFQTKEFVVVTATTIAEALQLASETPFQILLLDIGLAGESGLDLLPLLKQNHAEIRTLILTGLGYDADLMNDALQKGADGYVTKGAPLDELLATVNRTLAA